MIFCGDHYEYRIGGKVAIIDLDHNIVNENEFSPVEIILIKWAII